MKITFFDHFIVARRFKCLSIERVCMLFCSHFLFSIYITRKFCQAISQDCKKLCNCPVFFILIWIQIKRNLRDLSKRSRLTKNSNLILGMSNLFKFRIKTKIALKTFDFSMNRILSLSLFVVAQERSYVFGGSFLLSWISSKKRMLSLFQKWISKKKWQYHTWI